MPQSTVEATGPTLYPSKDEVHLRSDLSLPASQRVASNSRHERQRAVKHRRQGTPLNQV
jgi:hypothetical protein